MIDVAATTAPVSSAQVWAAVITGIVVGVIGLINIGVTVWQGHQTRTVSRREQWWTRFTWAAEGLLSESDMQWRMSASVFVTLGTVKWAQADDRTMILELLNEANRDVYPDNGGNSNDA